MTDNLKAQIYLVATTGTAAVTAFGFDLSAEQQTAVLACLAAVLGLLQVLTRNGKTPSP